MMHALASTIGNIRSKFPTDEIILLGDFNLPKIQWQQHHEIPGALSPYSDTTFTLVEQTFINMCSTYCLHQINSTVNSDGRALDLILTTEILNFNIEIPDPNDQIDNNSRHHSAVTLAINYISTAANQQNYITIRRINNQKASEQLSLTPFNLFEDSEFQIDFDEESSHFVDKINYITNTINTVISQNTRIENYSNSESTTNIKASLDQR